MKRAKGESVYEYLVKQRIQSINDTIESCKLRIFNNDPKIYGDEIETAEVLLQEKNTERLRIARFTSLTPQEAKLKKSVKRAVTALNKHMAEAEEIPSIA